MIVTMTDVPVPLTSTMTPLPPTDAPLPTKTFESTSTVAAPTPMDTATPKPVFKLCSPLAEQSLKELSEIVSDPYNPPRAGSDERHHGTDISYYRRKDRNTIAGEAVQALVAGQVVASGPGSIALWQYGDYRNWAQRASTGNNRSVWDFRR